MASAKRRFDWHLQWFSSFLWNHLAVHEWILNAWVVLNQPVLAQLEVEVLKFVEGEGVVIPPIKISDFGRFLCDLGRWSRTRISVSRLQAEFRGMHVVLLTA